jgi:hypothetical protein
MIIFSVRKPKIPCLLYYLTMSSNISDLHKILKDETRRKAIILLHERGNLSYVDLMKSLEIANTGKMNYHIRVLGDLLTKTDEGKYVLTEKGKLASRLTLEFPETRNQRHIEPELPRWLLRAAIVLAVGFAVGFLAMYIRGIIDFSRFALSLFIAVSSLVVFIVSDRIRKKKAYWSPNRQMLANEIGMIAFGALAGLAVFLIGGSLFLYAFETLLQSAGFDFVLFPFIWWVIVSFIFGPVIGGFIGYLYFKRSRYSKTSYYNPFS